MNVRTCCPTGRGCNSHQGDEVCALKLCRSAVAELEEAAQAMLRWQILEQARNERERRFRRRAYERVRDRALIALALRGRVASAAAASPPPVVVKAPARAA